MSQNIPPRVSEPLREIMQGESQVFSLRRLSLYYHNFITTEKRELLIMLLAVLLLPMLIVVCMAISLGPEYEYAAKFPETVSNPGYLADMVPAVTALMLVVVSAICGSMMFQKLSGKNSRIPTIEVPASQLEKFVCRLTVYLPCGIIMTLLSVWLADIVGVLILKCFYEGTENVTILSLSKLITLGQYKEAAAGQAAGVTNYSEIAIAYIGALTANAIYAFGSILFHKNSLVKTSVFLFVVNSICITLIMFSATIFFPEGFSVGDTNMTDAQQTMTIVVTGTVVSAIFYVLAYMRMREQEIINRW